LNIFECNAYLLIETDIEFEEGFFPRVILLLGFEVVELVLLLFVVVVVVALFVAARAGCGRDVTTGLSL